MFESFLSLALSLFFILIAIIVSTKIILSKIVYLYSEVSSVSVSNKIELKWINSRIEESIRLSEKTIKLLEKNDEIKNLNGTVEEDREERWNRIRKAFDKKEKEKDGSS